MTAKGALRAIDIISEIYRLTSAPEKHIDKASTGFLKGIRRAVKARPN